MTKLGERWSLAPVFSLVCQLRKGKILARWGLKLGADFLIPRRHMRQSQKGESKEVLVGLKEGGVQFRYCELEAAWRMIGTQVDDKSSLKV